MKKWFKKSLVVVVSILTFGMVTPAHAIWNDNQDVEKSQQHGSKNPYRKQSTFQTAFDIDESTNHAKSNFDREDFIEMLKDEAEKQSFEKFGAKISPVIEDEFRDVILPNIQKAIEHTMSEYPDEELASLTISETPTGGVSEKIFHIYNTDTKEDVIRFHVRRDHPPMEGYYFNFHYHTKFDHYQTHYSLGEIYWDKNTPPKWMTV